jgi:nitrile hydratase alpha subunit
VDAAGFVLYISAMAANIHDLYENEIGPHIGAQVIAKAWSDPAFGRRSFPHVN